MPIYKVYDYKGKYWKHLKMSKTEAKSMRKHLHRINPKIKLKISKKK